MGGAGAGSGVVGGGVGATASEEGAGAFPRADTAGTGRAPKSHSPSARNNIPQANPSANIPAVLARIFSYSCKIAGVPGFTMFANSEASQLVSLMQPWDIVCPMSDGSGVP